MRRDNAKNIPKNRTPSKKSDINIEHAQEFSKHVLPVKTGINQIPLFFFPFGAAPVIEQFFCILNDKWNDGKPQAFFQSNQSADSPVAVLERMSTFKLIMKTDYVVPCLSMVRRTFSRSAIHMLPCTCQWSCQ